MVANFARQHAAPAGSKPPLSTYSGSDRHYRSGTGDPPLRADAGAGTWNSHATTAAVLAKQVAIMGLIAKGATLIYPGPNATRHLQHYFLNTGLKYSIDLENMVSRVPSARSAMVSEFRQAQAFLRTLPVGRHAFTSLFGQVGYNEQAESADWFFATGGYTRWGKGEAIISMNSIGRHYEVDFEYCCYDRYNWDGGKAVTILGMTITDEFMGEFHRQGLAREFDCYGSIKRKLEWDGDFGAPDKTLIVRRPGR